MREQHELPRDLYFRQLGCKPAARSKKMQEAALDRAYELRSFEIELVWKRATYFFLSQAAVFAAFGYTLRDMATIGLLIPEALAALGLATAWFGALSSIGSRFWQQNWEHHIDLLESELEGELHKTVVKKPRKLSFSVSRSQMFLAFALVVFWLSICCFVAVRALPEECVAAGGWPFGLALLGVLAILALALGLSAWFLRSNIRSADSRGWQPLGNDHRILHRKSAVGSISPNLPEAPPPRVRDAAPAARSATGRTSGNPRKATRADR